MNLEEITILIVDDMQFSRESVRISLQKCGATNILTAENALQALKLVDKHSPEVILVDKMMPKVDGLKLTERIRVKDREKGTYSYVILLTADESENALREAMLSGADHYLYKDAKGDKIVNCIEYIDTQYRAKKILAELEDQERRQRNKQDTRPAEPEAEVPAEPDNASNEALIESAVEEMIEPVEEEASGEAPHPRELSYLIIDDEEFSAENIKRVLKKLDITDIRIARNALEALKMHSKQEADVMLVDYMMPKVDGIKLTEKVRSADNGQKTAIIMVTAAASLKKIEEAITAGVDEYLYKPPNAHDLVVRMEAAYKKHNPEAPLAGISWSKLF